MEKHIADKIVTLRLPQPMFEKFRDKCNADFKNMSEALREMIRNYIKDKP